MKKFKLLINSLLSIIITLICVYLFLNSSNNTLDLLQIIDAIYSNWYYLLGACLLLIISVYCRAYRWQYLFSTNIKINSSALFKSQLIGYFINNILPIRVGDIIRSYAVAKQTNQQTSYVIGTIAMERVLDTIMILLFSLISIWYYGIDYLDIQYSWMSSLLLIIFLIPILGYLFYKLIFTMIFPIKLKQIFQNIWDGFLDIQLSHKWAIIGYSIIIWSIYCLNVFFIQAMFSQLGLNIFDCLLILVASSFLQMVPVGFGAFGVFHLGVQGALHTMGIGNEQNFVIMLHLYSLFIYTIYGGYFFLNEKTLNIKKLYHTLINQAD